MGPVQVAQVFVDAVNARDVDRVVGCFSADAVVMPLWLSKNVFWNSA